MYVQFFFKYKSEGRKFTFVNKSGIISHHSLRHFKLILCYLIGVKFDDIDDDDTNDYRFVKWLTKNKVELELIFTFVLKKPQPFPNICVFVFVFFLT